MVYAASVRTDLFFSGGFDILFNVFPSPLCTGYHLSSPNSANTLLILLYLFD